VSDLSKSSVRENIANIQARIRAANDVYCNRVGIDRSVSLVAVSKRQPEYRVDEALNAGVRVFGENRIQEAKTRWWHRRELYADLTLHLIGPLQTNKVADAVALFDVIEVVDRPKLAKLLVNEMSRQNRHLECFVQVNTGEEEQKSGIAPNDVDSFIAYCRDEIGLNVSGLMCIPPVDEEVAMHFALLSTIANRNGLSNLSMGMSSDFEEAIAFGANHVRVGSAIFGSRDRK
jgi:pyridoxal phosphate enzyme (YggS family)